MPYEFNPFAEEFDFYLYEPTEYKAKKEEPEWSSLANMPKALRGCCVASDHNSNLYVAGGATDRDFFCKYDASSGIWTTLTDLPFTTYFGFGCFLTATGTFHVIGGVDSSGNRLDTHYVWDGSSWTSSGSLNTKRYSLSGCVYNGDIYVSHGGGESGLLSSAEKWTPSTSAFTTLSNSAAHARYTQDAAVLNGKMVVCCGYNSAGDTRYIEEFDFATETWSDKTPSSGPPTARRYLACGTVGNKVYIAVGYNSGHTSGSQIVESWDGSTCQTEDDCPSPARWICGVGDFRDGKLYLIGGKTSSDIDDVDVLEQKCYPIEEKC